MNRMSLLSCLLGLTLVGAHARQTAPRPQSTGDPPPTGFSKVFTLWSGNAPLSRGWASSDVPKLYYYPAQGTGVRSAVIVLPGGGYTHVVMEKEGAVEAKWLATRGVAAFVLQYRLSPTYRYPVPLLDGERAVRYVRSHATEFGVEPDRIGVWGFSAGGHMAGYLATTQEERNPSSSDPVERVSAHPDFAIFSYARLSLDPAIPRAGNMESLLGDSPTQAMLDSISAVKHVSRDTSPSFLYSTTADATVDSRNATAYYDALKRVGVPVELHIFELGPHGTGMGQNLKGLAELEVWPLLLQHWMEMHGWMATTAPER